MKKKGKWALLLVTLLCSLAFCGYVFATKRMADHEAPEISFETEELQVSIHDGRETLLEGVSARDTRDGDVTAFLVLEGVSAISEEKTAVATYAAFDQAGNVAKAQRTLRYRDYRSPRFSLSGPLVFRSGLNVDMLRYIGAEDVLDGVLDEQIKAALVGGESNITEEGIHEVEFRVTNSMGDTSYLTVPVEVYPSGAYNAAVELKEYLVYLEKGESFSADSYLKSMRIGTRDIPLQGDVGADVKIDVSSDVDPMKAGTYSVAYTVKSGSYAGYTRLIVVVEE